MYFNVLMSFGSQFSNQIETERLKYISIESTHQDDILESTQTWVPQPTPTSVDVEKDPDLLH